MIMVGCSRCTYPSIHLFVSRSRSVVRGAMVCCVLCVHEGVVLRGVCDVCVVCCVGVGVWWWWCCVLLGLCGGEVCIFVSFSLFSLSSLLSLSCSRSFFLLSSLFSLPFLFFFSLHFSPRRPTSRHLNVIEISPGVFSQCVMDTPELQHFVLQRESTHGCRTPNTMNMAAHDAEPACVRACSRQRCSYSRNIPGRASFRSFT